ncbi:hypothetical protein [Methylomonas sp. UP202]|uniref:hypothetical protein n=1 Tax=Methylomonas sp. UP202 TaxID=3040943 RepID=UPI002478897B|nr:hypothetical protein [Methylomonas sp. UP202]WGS86641.1 hypothetical protein QC632_02520 [Methylomonas sp. UP202]
MIDSDLIGPVELIHAIQNLKSGFEDSYTIDSIARVSEESARKVLASKGYHPHLDIYGYVDDPELSPSENWEARKQSDRSDWVNEAIHLKQHPDPEVMAAAFAIIESSSLRDHIHFGEMEKAIISMANMLACSMLHLDQRKDELTALMRDKFIEIKPDVELGKSTRKNQERFAKERGKQQTEEREREWERWRQCAEAIKTERKHIKSKSELARQVKRRLGLADSPNTIRRHIY